jgi:hypothetical protein
MSHTFKNPNRLGPKGAKIGQVPGESTVIAGVPSFWQTAHDQMPQFFAVANDLPALVSRIL